MGDVKEHATALADAIEAALPGWVERSVARRMAEAGRSEPEVAAAAAVAGVQARREVGPRVRTLLDADIDEQRSTPLSLLREAARYPTEVLRSAGVEPVERDEMQAALFPDDVYDLTPATFADVDPALAEPGLAWGAAKAWNHRRRHAGSPPRARRAGGRS
jgi:hypothetical protein